MRFPEFEKVLPHKSLGSVITILSGIPIKGENVTENEKCVPILRGINITEGAIRHTKEIDRYYNGELDLLEKFFLKEDDLVLGMDGSKVGKNVALIKKENHGAILIQRVARLRGIENVSDIKFIYHNIFNFKFRKYVEVVNTSSGIPHISLTQIKNYKIGVPDFHEQKKIGYFLNLIDLKIETQNKIIARLESLMLGIMQSIFSQKFRFKGVKQNPFPEWKEKKIGEIMKIGNGRDYKHLDKGNIPVYGTGGLMAFVNEAIYEGESVGIGRKGTIDKPIFLNGKFWTVDTLFYSHSFKGVKPKFLYYLFQQINWKKYNEASGVPSLSKKTISQIVVEIPCLKEQAEVIKLLNSLEKKIEQELKFKTLLEKQKLYFLRNLFI